VGEKHVKSVHTASLFFLVLRRLRENALERSLSFISHLIMLFVHFPKGNWLDFISSRELGEPYSHPNSKKRVQVIQPSFPPVYSHIKQNGSAFYCAWIHETNV
jgi:hypothetical protein